MPFLRGVNLAGNDRFLGATTWPTEAGMRYWLDHGFNLFRVMTLWENLQPPVDGRPSPTLDPANLAGLRRTVDFLTTRGAWVIIDSHNYLRYKASGRNDDPGSVIGQSGVGDADYARFWRALAGVFKANPRVIFEISTNEPHDIDVNRMASTFQAAIAAVRATGARNMLLVDGTNFSGAYEWETAGNGAAMLRLRDPADNLVFAPHLYVDGFGGQQQGCRPGEGPSRLTTVTQWARHYHKRLLMDEWGVGDNADCYAAIREIRDYVENGRDVFIGDAAFAAYAGQRPYKTPDNFWLAMDRPGAGGDDRRVRELTAPLAPLPAARSAVAADALIPVGGEAAPARAPDGAPASRLTESVRREEHALHTPAIQARPGIKYQMAATVSGSGSRRNLSVTIIDQTTYRNYADAVIDLATGAVASTESAGGGCLTAPTVHVRRLPGASWRVEIGTIFRRRCASQPLAGSFAVLPGDAARPVIYQGDGRAALRVAEVGWTAHAFE